MPSSPAAARNWPSRFPGAGSGHEAPDTCVRRRQTSGGGSTGPGSEDEGRDGRENDACAETGNASRSGTGGGTEAKRSAGA